MISKISNGTEGESSNIHTSNNKNSANVDRGHAGNHFGSASYSNDEGGRGILRVERFSASASELVTGERKEVAELRMMSRSNTHKTDLPLPNTTARCEIDNLADTCCLGMNFTPTIYFTGKVF
jgi:hypothetical protein